MLTYARLHINYVCACISHLTLAILLCGDGTIIPNLWIKLSKLFWVIYLEAELGFTFCIVVPEDHHQATLLWNLSEQEKDVIRVATLEN